MLCTFLTPFRWVDFQQHMAPTFVLPSCAAKSTVRNAGFRPPERQWQIRICANQIERRRHAPFNTVDAQQVRSDATCQKDRAVTLEATTIGMSASGGSAARWRPQRFRRRHCEPFTAQVQPRFISAGAECESRLRRERQWHPLPDRQQLLEGCR